MPRQAWVHAVTKAVEQVRTSSDIAEIKSRVVGLLERLLRALENEEIVDRTRDKLGAERREETGTGLSALWDEFQRKLTVAQGSYNRQIAEIKDEYISKSAPLWKKHLSKDRQK